MVSCSCLSQTTAGALAVFEWMDGMSLRLTPVLAPHTHTLMHAGNAIATSGEDGQVKIWSRAGMLRSTIMEAEDPVFCLAWGGSAGSQLLVCSGSTVSIRSLQGAASGPAAAAANGLSGGGGGFRGRGNNGSSSVQACWKAHDGIVLKADWNVITGLIVTGGEDCRCKVRWQQRQQPAPQREVCTTSVTHLFSAPQQKPLC